MTCGVEKRRTILKNINKSTCLGRITKMAYSMVTMYGMNNVIGVISF